MDRGFCGSQVEQGSFGEGAKAGLSSLYAPSVEWHLAYREAVRDSDFWSTEVERPEVRDRSRQLTEHSGIKKVKKAKKDHERAIQTLKSARQVGKVEQPNQTKTKQNKPNQNKTKQNETKQNNTTQHTTHNTQHKTKQKKKKNNTRLRQVW